MKDRLNKFIILVPLHLPYLYPSDYLLQTGKILAKRNFIVFFNPTEIPFSWKQLFGEGEIRQYIKSVIKILTQNRGYIYFKSIALLPFQRYVILHKLMYKMGLWQLRLFLFLRKKKKILWIFDPSLTYFVDIFSSFFTVYDCIDCLAKDPQIKEITTLEKTLFKKADLISFNSQGLYELKTRENKGISHRSIVTVCGCNYKIFSKNKSEIPNDLINIKGKRIILAGILNFRIDVKLLDYLAQKNKNINFIIIGLIESNLSKKFFNIIQYPNVYYLGSKDKKVLPTYFHYSDVGIIPYDTCTFLVRYSNPMKAYEYAASGLPVVSTDIYVLRNYTGKNISIAKSPSEFSSLIRQYSQEHHDNNVKEMQKIAKINSWENKITKIEKTIIEIYEKQY